MAAQPVGREESNLRTLVRKKNTHEIFQCEKGKKGKNGNVHQKPHSLGEKIVRYVDIFT